MRKALFFTVFNRPQYFQQVLNSWKHVRGLEDWAIRVFIDPNDFAAEQEVMVYDAFRNHDDVEVYINPQTYGAPHNPWVGFDKLFGQNYDFVVLSDDDLVVSADILEYFNWAAEEFQNDPKVAAVVGYTDEDGEDPSEARLIQGFGSWVWGTWDDRWEGLVGPTWDHNYSTYNIAPGNEAGWDWNLNTRLYPQHDLRSVFPTRSRVHNIGVSGVHALPQDYHSSSSFSIDHGELDYRVVDS